MLGTTKVQLPHKSVYPQTQRNKVSRNRTRNRTVALKQKQVNVSSDVNLNNRVKENNEFELLCVSKRITWLLQALTPLSQLSSICCHMQQQLKFLIPSQLLIHLSSSSSSTWRVSLLLSLSVPLSSAQPFRSHFQVEPQNVSATKTSAAALLSHSRNISLSFVSLTLYILSHRRRKKMQEQNTAIAYLHVGSFLILSRDGFRGLEFSCSFTDLSSGCRFGFCHALDWILKLKHYAKPQRPWFESQKRRGTRGEGGTEKDKERLSRAAAGFISRLEATGDSLGYSVNNSVCTVLLDVCVCQGCGRETLEGHLTDRVWIRLSNVHLVQTGPNHNILCSSVVKVHPAQWSNYTATRFNHIQSMVFTPQRLHYTRFLCSSGCFLFFCTFPNTVDVKYFRSVYMW